MKKIFYVLIFLLSFLLYGCSFIQFVDEEEQIQIEEEKQEEIVQEEYDFNKFATDYINYTDTLNSYMQILIDTYTNDNIIDSYNNIKTIKENTASMNVKKISNKDYQNAVDYLDSYELIVFELSNLILKSYDKTLKIEELSRLQELSEQSLTYSEACNTYANVFEKYIQ